MNNKILLANISKSSYQDEDERPKQFDDYVLDDELSDDDVVVYNDKNKYHTIIGFRGTSIDKAPVRDLRTDTGILTGAINNLNPFSSYNKRYNRSVEKIDEIMKNKQGNDFLFTGHSLGGHLAGDMAMKYKIPAVGFSTGKGLPTMNDIRCLVPGFRPAACNMITNYNTILDPLSFLNTFYGKGKLHLQLPSKFNTHSIDNFATY